MIINCFVDAGVSRDAIESRSIPPPYRPHVPDTPSEEMRFHDEEPTPKYLGKVDFSDF
jgi:hypothetical protein